MSGSPLFSICIPCFNHEKYIGATIQSVLEQDFDNFEIIIADNASSDGSLDIVRSFKDSRLKVIQNRYNIGFGPNLQQVTRHATGRYFNLLSSDDIMNRGALETYADIIARYTAYAHQLVLMSQTWEIDSEGKVFRYITKSAEQFAPVRVSMPRLEDIDAQQHHEIYRGFDVFANCMQRLNTAGLFCSVVYSRELWESVEGYNSTQWINPDMHFIIKLLRLDPLVIYVNRPLYSYRTHDQGQAAQQSRAQVLKFHADQYNYLLQYDDDWLRGTGVTRKHQRRIFVNRDCCDQALVALAESDWIYATRLLAFAWATYPAVVIGQWKAWALACLLTCGPLGCGVACVLRWIYKMSKKGLPCIDEVSGPMRKVTVGHVRGSVTAVRD